MPHKFLWQRLPMFDTAGAGAGTPPPAGTTPPPTAPWYEGKADAEIIGHWQNRGWHDKDAVTVAIEATKAHRQAEKFIGVPADQVIRLPKDASDEAGWKQVWSRLGASSDPKDYVFNGPDGKPIEGPLGDFLRDRAAKLQLPKDKAAALAADLVKHTQDTKVAEKVELDAKVAEEKGALAKSWGKNMEANMFVAKQAAAKLGVSPDQVAALEGVVGYAKVMELFRSIGARIGEDKFVSSTGPTPGVMTREQAVAKKAELMADSAWAKRYLSGGAPENREMTALLTLIAGDDTERSRNY